MILSFIVLGVALGILSGVATAMIMKRTAVSKSLSTAESIAQTAINKANTSAQELVAQAHRQAESIITQARKNMDSEIQSRQAGVQQLENRLMQKERHLNERESRLDEKEETLNRELERVKVLTKKREELIENLSTTLEQIAGLSKADAEKQLLASVEHETRKRAGAMIKDMEDKARKVASRKAKEIVTQAIQRIGGDYIAAVTTSAVQLPDDEMKGRIIGREGRNIRSFEALTGVDVIIDDTPGAVILSCFDPIRREIAKMALSKLVHDGRIHPTRIEEAVEKAKSELDETIRETGERAIEELGIQMHPKLIEMVGRLKYRTSYGQDMLSHAVETAKIAANIADALGVNIDLAKRGGLLHDIGKAIDFEAEGTHTALGEELCRKYGESDEVINCINAHHEDEEPDTIEAIIVMQADAISSVRPGARRESVEQYVKRLEKLEALAKSYEGVENAFALQAGREIRVMVKPEEVNDTGAHEIAQRIAKQIEAELEYPGEVKVSVIRETRAFGIAH